MNRALPFIMVVDDLVDGRAFCMENQTLGQKAVEEIIELIKEKNYAPGDKLPTEKERVSYTHLDVYKRQRLSPPALYAII